MVLRYEEITGEGWDKKVPKGRPYRNLENLFDWLLQHDLIEHSTTGRNADMLRHTRNYFAYPKNHGIGGGAHLKRIYDLLFLISDLIYTIPTLNIEFPSGGIQPMAAGSPSNGKVAFVDNSVVR